MPYPSSNVLVTATGASKLEPLVITNTTAMRDLIENRQPKYRFHVSTGSTRLLASTKVELLEKLQCMGYGASKIAVDVAYEHTIWMSIDQARAWYISDQDGHNSIVCNDGMIESKGAAKNPPEFTKTLKQRDIVKALGGVVVQYMHRPGRKSRNYGRSDFPQQALIVFAKMRDKALAALVLGPEYDLGSYYSTMWALNNTKRVVGDMACDDLDPAVESAIEAYREEMSIRNLNMLQTVFELAYSDQIQKHVERWRTFRPDDRLGFPS